MMALDAGPQNVDIGTSKSLDVPGTSPAETLAPIRRLVRMAIVGVVLSVLMLFGTAMHVLGTIDAASRQAERARAAWIADILAAQAPVDEHSLPQLAEMSGLKGLKLTELPLFGGGGQSIPLLSGPASGKFLSWTAEQPGRDLFAQFAPLRLPLSLGMIGAVMVCLVLLMRHVQRLESQRRQAERRSLQDHLTGLPNRLALELEMRRLVASGQEFSVLALDLDRFKPVNDHYGHHAGDLALVEIARRLKRQLRPDETLARIGGDEFVAIIRRGGQRPMLERLAKTLVAAVAQPLHVVAPDVRIGVSLGIVADGRMHPTDMPLKVADRALYEAKRRHGGGYCFAGDTADQEPSRRADAPMPLLAAV